MTSRQAQGHSEHGRGIKRIAALLSKELEDLLGNPALFVPAVITGAISILIPLAIAIAIPHFTGERLSDSTDFKTAATVYYDRPAGLDLDAEGAIQALIFQQFLIL